MGQQKRVIRVVIVGGGISGIATAIRLKGQLGEAVELTILEKAAAPGGVWRDSTWPGAGVDVPIHMYSLYSDLNPDWTQRYARQAEVLAYWEALIDKHNLRPYFRFSTAYVSSTWSPVAASHTLRLSTPSGPATLTADILIGANGPLSKPIIPSIPGLDSFRGTYFHNLRWQKDCPFEGKRVAVVGNGSSGVQLVPGVAAIPGVKLTHFVRSGGYFMPKENFEYGVWVRWAFRWVPGLQRAYRFRLFLEANALWSARPLAQIRPTPRETQLLSYLATHAPAKYLDLLRPDFPLGCKRTAYDAGWLKALHRDNVELVRDPIVRIDESTLITKDGRRFEVDVIVFATGSDVARHGVGVNVGLEGEVPGLTLEKHWEAIGGPQAFLGTAVPGFPNVFQVLGPNATSSSWGYTIGLQSRFVASLVKGLYDNDLATLEPTQAAFDTHNAETRAKLALTPTASQECTNWSRVGGKGLVSVTGWRNGFQLERRLRHIDWTEWVGKRRVEGWKGLEVVDVAREVRARRLRRAALWATVFGALVAGAYVAPGHELLVRGLDAARQTIAPLLGAA